MEKTPYNYPTRVLKWALHTFTNNLIYNSQERCAHFMEEALELVQSLGFKKNRVLQLVEYVYDRPWCEPKQELGGVMNTLNLLAITHSMDIHNEAEIELSRCWDNIQKIREKNDLKPKPYLNDSIRGNNPTFVINDFDPLGR